MITIFQLCTKFFRNRCTEISSRVGKRINAGMSAPDTVEPHVPGSQSPRASRPGTPGCGAGQPCPAVPGAAAAGVAGGGQTPRSRWAAGLHRHGCQRGRPRRRRGASSGHRCSPGAGRASAPAGGELSRSRRSEGEGGGPSSAETPGKLHLDGRWRRPHKPQRGKPRARVLEADGAGSPQRFYHKFKSWGRSFCPSKEFAHRRRGKVFIYMDGS